METIINKIRSILDDRMLKAGLYFDNKYTAYIGILKKEAQLSYGYFFDLRKKKWTRLLFIRYFFINTSRRNSPYKQPNKIKIYRGT